jgi:AraC family transcriptional regulator of adaptative response/methylated-DNA-[protein]-cysteine methyltransferase
LQRRNKSKNRVVGGAHRAYISAMTNAALRSDIAFDADAGAHSAQVARAIAYLAENFAAQPSLDEAAREAGLSPFHFQRVFTRYAGVSPKNFVAHLTLERAKDSLRRGQSVSAAAWNAGLSGASRLHDLALKIEAMTPGEYAKGGAGLVIGYDFAASLFGTALLLATGKGLCGLAFGEDEGAMLADMRARWPRADFVRDAARLASYGEKIFSAAKGELPIQLFGTPWQIQVWQALLAIPEGNVVSYGDIATRLRAARASRAVGAAVGRNPISLLIPCHRVLAANGAITGYHWGTTRKRAMLALEAARRDEAAAS